MKIRFLILSALISIGLLYVACGQPPERHPARPALRSKRDVEQKKTVRVRHLSGEVLAVNSKTKTITVRFRDEDLDVHFDDSTVVKIDLDTVKPSEIPVGTRATVKYIERKGQFVAKGIFISTETAEKKEGIPQSFYRNSAKQVHRPSEVFSPSVHERPFAFHPSMRLFCFQAFVLYRKQNPERTGRCCHESIAAQADPS